MNVKRYYWGFTPSLFDADMVITVNDDGSGGSGTVTFATSATSGYYHGLADTGGTPAGTFTDFAAALESAINTATGGSLVVTWSNSALTYQIASGGAIDLTLSTWAQRVLGFSSASPTPAASLTSDVRPWFVSVPNVDCVARLDEGDPRVYQERFTDGGRGFMVGPSRIAMDYSWVQQHEAHEATREYQASVSAPFTWEHAFHTCAGYVPFLLVDSDSSAITYASDVVGRFQLTGQGARFRPRRSDGRTNARWDVRFETRCLERVKA